MGKRSKSEDDGSLPFFKLFMSQWIGKDITLCSLSSQGLFINLCAHYWLEKGNLSYHKMKVRFKRKQKHFDELVNNNIIKLNEDQIRISFLDDQLIERNAVSDQNRKNIQDYWNRIKSDTVVHDSNNERTSIVIPKEEKRREEEEKRREETPVYDKKIVALNPTPETLAEAEVWTESVIEGNDSLFTDMLRKQSVKLDGLERMARDHLELSAKYSWHSRWTTQQEFRYSLMNFVKEQENKKPNERAKGISGQGRTDPERGKDYKAEGF